MQIKTEFLLIIYVWIGEYSSRTKTQLTIGWGVKELQQKAQLERTVIIHYKGSQLKNLKSVK